MPVSDAAPVQITCWTKDMVRRGTVDDVNKVDLDVVFNGGGAASFAIDSDHPRAGDLTVPGARCVIDYFPDWDSDDPLADPMEPITLSGSVDEITGEGPEGSAVRTFAVTDDWHAVFTDLQGWPNPTGTPAQQGNDTAYFTRSGPAETVLKQVVAPNATRQGLELVIPTNLGRGSNIAVALRMHPLGDKLFPAVDIAGLGVRVVQRNNQLVLECWVPAVHTRVLDEGSGVIVEGSYQRRRPTVTRVMVGAGGEGTARVFRHYIDAPRETEWGRRNRREVFIDARDVDVAEPALETILASRAQEALDEGRARAGLTAKLAETDEWRLGKTFNIGDTSPLQVSDGPILTDRIRRAHITWDENGLEVTPYVGDWEDTVDEVIVAAVTNIARGYRDLQRSR